MKRISIRERGLVATLFYSGKPTSAVIVLGGSSGGIKEIRAEQLAEQGFATLALAYFAEEHLPATLNQIPIEYFQPAIERLKELPGIKKIGIWGVSRGAELSLILGTFFSTQIDAIAAHVPSSVIYGALDDHPKPAWTYQGKPIAPGAPFRYDLLFSSGNDPDQAVSVTPCFLGGMEDKKIFSASAIPVEKINCPLLLISAQDDQMWPSTLYSQQIVDRLKRYNSSICCTHLSYPGVGHSPNKGVSGFHPIMKRWFAYGGNPVDNARATVDWWEETVRFFKEKLTCF